MPGGSRRGWLIDPDGSVRPFGSAELPYTLAEADTWKATFQAFTAAGLRFELPDRFAKELHKRMMQAPIVSASTTDQPVRPRPFPTHVRMSVPVARRRP